MDNVAGKVVIHAATADAAIKLALSRASVAKVQVAGVDLVLVMADGTQHVFQGAALRALADPDFKLLFSDGAVEASTLIAQAGPVNITALDDKSSVILFGDVVLNDNEIRRRQYAIGRWDAVAQDHVDLLPEISKHPVKRKTRTQTVPVGTDVRSDHETLLLFYKLYNLTKHDYFRLRAIGLCGASFWISTLYPGRI